jgi:hypothetical protein
MFGCTFFRHHANLHSSWLRDHRDLHEPRYVDHVLGEEGSVIG